MLCPICNGLETYSDRCPSCDGIVADYGRVSDWNGPYSPYVSIEEEVLQIQDETIHAGAARCSHIIYCSACQQISEVFIAQWD